MGSTPLNFNFNFFERHWNVTLRMDIEDHCSFNSRLQIKPESAIVGP
jgi:hypothetical protein